MITVYYEKDADLSILKDKTMAIIGYGNQGRAQALNMRDSGLKVIIGNIEDSYWNKAVADGFEVYPIDRAAELGDLIFMHIPDEFQKTVYENYIRNKLKEGKALVFAHGHNINYGFIAPPKNVDVLLVAPRMLGSGVRSLFVSGTGAPAFVAVHQDATGEAWKRVLAISKAIGATRVGVIASSFAEETEIDQFMEQFLGAAIGRIKELSFEVLVEAGYAPEIVALEMFCSGEAIEEAKHVVKDGFFKSMEFGSRTAQYGMLTRGSRVISDDIKMNMREILQEIRTGVFAREWELEQMMGFPVFKKLKDRAYRHSINRVEEKIKKLVKIKIEE